MKGAPTTALIAFCTSGFRRLARVDVLRSCILREQGCVGIILADIGLNCVMLMYQWPSAPVRKDVHLY